ncbi:hypothetical protein RRU94_03590 [Domibacillus sp. DTU_2020_1001157_1_SI_ALB_TIR_016]|uniref:hypothetical protein n=1 Tax=Domibacillus sp. DTU_2020_1001157_1_SI_ALB_TIR_016 TaxID=3077789 RepID=UPI0028ED6DAF|nr:hypothetical protein [Domibacillus sp. DTU_2020_1001157_1_SI_ALB_TIR_016]WNS79011.1 hypothetical protein RRU94_03590 [Domibacillus sp. DTU_2020_1001157_1_SI_ALB_TIR_016]
MKKIEQKSAPHAPSKSLIQWGLGAKVFILPVLLYILFTSIAASYLLPPIFILFFYRDFATIMLLFFPYDNNEHQRE